MNSKITYISGVDGFIIKAVGGKDYMIQFGGLDVGSSGTITFKKPFPNYCQVFFTGSSERAQSNYAKELYPTHISTTSFSYYQILWEGRTANWLAIGY